MTRPLSSGILACLCVLASVAHGDELPGVSLSVDPCVDADSEQVERLFRVELGTSMSDAAAAGGTAGTKVELACDKALISIRVEDAVTGKSLERRISPGPRTGRERLLALAAMELLVASWVELEATPEPVAPAADSVVGKRERQSARKLVRSRLPQSRWSTTVIVVGGSSWTGGLRYGGGLRVTRDHTSGLGWSADMVAETARETASLGEVTTRSVSGALSAHASRRDGPVALRAAAGARLFAVSMRGEPDEPDAVLGRELTGFAGGPMARLVAQIVPTGGLTFALSLEAGVHLLEVRGTVDGHKEESLEGAWLSGLLGAGWTW